jgi:hypothetical protein
MRVRTFLLMMLILSASNAMALDVTMTATVNDDRLTVSGTTNLPDGTELLVTLSDTEGVYRAEGKTLVSKGTFKTGPISQPLSRDCTLNIISEMAVYQPSKVRSIIGDCGEMLAGKLVVKGSLGGLIVSYHDRIVLSKKVALRRKRTAYKPIAVTQRKVPSFNRYSSYCALKAAGRKDLPPITESLILR